MSDFTNYVPVELTQGDTLNFTYTGTMRKYLFPAGQYKFEICGASGGHPDPYPHRHGSGSRISGTLLLRKRVDLYVCVGECDTTLWGYTPTGSARRRTFNGGGRAGRDEVDSWADNGCNGGGATDIRAEQDLLSRFLVAGGGAGGIGWATDPRGDEVHQRHGGQDTRYSSTLGQGDDGRNMIGYNPWDTIGGSGAGGGYYGGAIGQVRLTDNDLLWAGGYGTGGTDYVQGIYGTPAAGQKIYDFIRFTNIIRKAGGQPEWGHGYIKMIFQTNKFFLILDGDNILV